MNTAITLAICLFLCLSLIIWDQLKKRVPEGNNATELLGHPYSEAGMCLFYRLLPNLRILGQIGGILFLCILVYAVCFVASFTDDTLSISGQGIGLIEDYVAWSNIVSVAIMLYVLGNVANAVPHTFESIGKVCNKSAKDERTGTPLFDKHIQQVAYTLFSKDKRWLIFDVIVTLALFLIVIFVYWFESMTSPEYTDWTDSVYPWGHRAGIVLWTFAVCYFGRLAIGYISRLVYAMYRFGKSIGDDNLIILQPMNADGAGGFREFGMLALRIDFLLLPIILNLVVWQIVKPETQTGFAIALVFVIIATPLFFLIPLLGLHSAMKTAKKDHLEIISCEYNRNVAIVNRWITNNPPVNHESSYEAQKKLDSIVLQHKQASHITNWPFDTRIVAIITIYVITPVTSIILSKYPW